MGTGHPPQTGTIYTSLYTRETDSQSHSPWTCPPRPPWSLQDTAQTWYPLHCGKVAHSCQRAQTGAGSEVETNATVTVLHSLVLARRRMWEQAGQGRPGLGTCSAEGQTTAHQDGLQGSSAAAQSQGGPSTGGWRWHSGGKDRAEGGTGVQGGGQGLCKGTGGAALVGAVRLALSRQQLPGSTRGVPIASATGCRLLSWGKGQCHEAPRGLVGPAPQPSPLTWPNPKAGG
jgi:hypothetical protein